MQPKFRRRNLAFALLVSVSFFLFCRSVSAAAETAPPAKTAPTVNVILWFDTEDYLLPADDDADKRLADMLSQKHIRATFKVVGEKARVLERRGRQDVIDALKQHDIGYHSNFHSVHPAPAEYLADCGLLDSIDENSSGAKRAGRRMSAESFRFRHWSVMGNPVRHGRRKRSRH